MKEFGLIGKKLGHSFSKNYFDEKFLFMGLEDHIYHLFELEQISDFPGLMEKHPGLTGLNVTIPYKEEVMRFMSSLDESAEKVGAVNVIKVLEDGSLKGYNSDYFGFRTSLTQWIKPFPELQAMVLGTGGASKAVQAVLSDLRIPYQLVSRTNKRNVLSYLDIEKSPILLEKYLLIINCTPLGMYPDVDSYPALNYTYLTEAHALFDLVYNPELTQFLKKGFSKGCHIKNGYEMLHLQAEKSWEIWTA